MANVLQTIVGAALLFALYRYINGTLGVEQLGVWSVVLATVSVSRLADLGLSAGVTRFVARDRARDDPDRASRVVDTAAVTLMISVGAVLPLAYVLLSKLLPHLLEAGDLVAAQDILAYALISLWLTVVAAVFQGALDGCQRMDLRAGVVVAGQALLLGFAIVLVPGHGLVGLAWAQVGQGVFLLMIGRLLLRHTLPTSSWLPRRWRWEVLREMLGYGVNVQTATVFMLLLDPLTKALMARFGGPAATGYFEMANQVVLKARAVIVTANQAVVPHVAKLVETAPSRLAYVYRENMRLLGFVTPPAFALLIAWSGGFSWLLMGEYRPEFSFLLGLLAVVWAFNVFASPAYFTNMGTGRVGWNTLSHAVMGALSAGLGWLLGSHYGAHGVAFAYSAALVTGSALLIGVFEYGHKWTWRAEFAREHLGVLFTSGGVVAIAWLFPVRPCISDLGTLTAQLTVPPLALGLAVWCHPMRRQLLGWLGARDLPA